MTERHVETCDSAEDGIRRVLEELRECRDAVERVTDASDASETFRGTLREAVDVAEELAAALAAGADALRGYMRPRTGAAPEGVDRGATAGRDEGSDPAPGFVPELAERLPPYGTRGEKTTGIVDLGAGRVVEQISGYDGPTRSMPRPRPGMDRNLLSHVEAHAVALMRRHGVTHATLYVNQEPCEYVGPRGRPWGCSRALPRMLYVGETLTVHGPGGYRRTFAGRTSRPGAESEQDDG